MLPDAELFGGSSNAEIAGAQAQVTLKHIMARLASGMLAVLSTGWAVAASNAANACAARHGKRSAYARVALILSWILSTFIIVAPPLHAEKRKFSVRDSIELRKFVEPDPLLKPVQVVQSRLFSRDRTQFAIVTQRGVLATNQLESTIWLFDVDTIRRFLSAEVRGSSIRPEALVSMSGVKTSSEGRGSATIRGLRWANDGKAIAFLGRTGGVEWHVYVVNIENGDLRQLTPNGQDVCDFDMQGEVVVYSVMPPYHPPSPSEVIVGTGRSLSSLLFPEEASGLLANPGELWLLRNSKSEPVENSESKLRIRVNPDLPLVLSLSPDGRFAVVSRTVDAVPKSWESYRPLAPVEHFEGGAEQYEIVNLSDGMIETVIDAPLARGVERSGPTEAIWSDDARRVLLTNTFLPLKDVDDAERARRFRDPAVVIYDTQSHEMTPVARLRSKSDEGGGEDVLDIVWNQGEGDVAVYYEDPGSTNKPSQVPELYREQSGIWNIVEAPSVNRVQKTPDNAENNVPLDIAIHQGLNTPPALFASLDDSAVSEEVWDPNPQLKDFDLGEAEVYNWKDRHGRLIKGVLLKPPDYIPGKRYPLVIEARSYSQNSFLLDGTYSTAVAARAMAADDMVVLQAGEALPSFQPKNWFKVERGTMLEGYETAITKLTTEGLVDPKRVGIIGFSRTCENVFYAITKRPDLFRAVTIANGLVYGLMQYSVLSDATPDGILDVQYREAYGSVPFGAGLKSYIAENPIFNVDKVTAAVRVETHSPMNMLADFETYIGLHALSKPVDFIVLPNATHVVSMPVDLLESQQGDVDWFRFWLQSYEDPSPARAEQYRRWEALRVLQQRALARGADLH
jgi:dipeptidyl aminopeptidase/acylaminoacyl peptidase